MITKEEQKRMYEAVSAEVYEKKRAEGCDCVYATAYAESYANAHVDAYVESRSIEIARNLKEDGIPVSTISKATGLSADEIARL